MNQVKAHWNFKTPEQAFNANRFLKRTIIGWDEYATLSGNLITCQMDSFASSQDEFVAEQRDLAYQASQWAGVFISLEIVASTTQEYQYKSYLA